MLPCFTLLCVLLSLIYSIQSLNNVGVTIDLIHRDSTLSPSHDSSKTRFQRLRSAFDRSFSRKASLFAKQLNATTDAPLSGISGAYVMEYKIGTPPVRQLSIADTGSDLTWIQCQPCTSCYNQNYPIFNPGATSSYRLVSCDTDECAKKNETDGTGCSESNVCEYRVYYGDGSFSSGDVATDTLTLGSASFPKFVFGCGSNNYGTFKAIESGIFGLGNGAISFVNQQRSSVSGRFSYCLTPLDSNVPSKISFGSNAAVNGTNVLSTPLVSKDPATFYYLTLQGISVGEKKFEYKSSGTKQQAEQGNIIIDSGTTLTFVPSEMYESVEEALKSSIKGRRVEDPKGMFGLCYRVSSHQVTPPPITAHFEGADLVLNQESMFLEVSNGVACLTLVPSPDMAIFGNLHQVGYLVGYDLVNKQVNFLKTDCTKHH